MYWTGKPEGQHYLLTKYGDFLLSPEEVEKFKDLCGQLERDILFDFINLYMEDWWKEYDEMMP